ncbi:DUF6461 domain-containing protein [Planomonospora corallina]|uniref:DUF6461 domain-containing protein n=1 Tax=Planomonospora corallina TaxID=1806052 RepID=A0ABV8IH77_9ACTN
MSGATAGEYEWLHQEFTDGVGDTWLCVSFVQGLPPREVLRRIDVVPGTVGDFGVEAYAAGGGTVLIDYGWGTSVGAAPGLLSSGTTMAAVFSNVGDDGFSLLADGEPITKFGLYGGGYAYRDGDLPGRLLPDLRELGLDRDDPADPVPAALALASRATGVRFTRGHYGRAALSGASDHLQ